MHELFDQASIVIPLRPLAIPPRYNIRTTAVLWMARITGERETTSELAPFRRLSRDYLLAKSTAGGEM